ncbi:hypothetical protein GCM10029992_21220 [Glycomyces albus]
MSSTSRRATKAVIPAAGFATRFLPVTKAVPKELLPIVDKPVLQYIVEEAAAAGLGEVTLVTAAGKDSMIDYFDARADLDNALEAKGKDAMLAKVKAPESIAEITAIRQGGAKGLGHAVGRAEASVGDEPFAVLLGDEFCHLDDKLLPRMTELQAETGGIVLALMEVPERTFPGTAWPPSARPTGPTSSRSPAWSRSLPSTTRRAISSSSDATSCPGPSSPSWPTPRPAGAARSS